VNLPPVVDPGDPEFDLPFRGDKPFQKGDAVKVGFPDIYNRTKRAQYLPDSLVEFRLRGILLYHLCNHIVDIRHKTPPMVF
jgi:hypothetical protein